MDDSQKYHFIDIDSKPGIEVLLTEVERKRQLGNITLITKIGVIFMSCFGVYSLFTDNIFVGIVLLISAFLTQAAYAYAMRTGNLLYTRYMDAIISIGLYFFLLITGGINNTGALWCFPLLLILVFTLEERLGNWLGALVLIFCAAFLYLIDPLWNQIYNHDFSLRFLGAQLAAFSLSRAIENSRVISEEKISQIGHDFYHVALHDPLTGLLNRRAILDQMNYEYIRTKRNKNIFSIMFVDIDHFKKVNDTYGHDFGDQVIIETGKIIKNILREQDMISRWGGEEYVLFFPDSPDKVMSDVSSRILAEIRSHTHVFNTEEIHITVSIGIACYKEGDSVDDVINRADACLYKAKQQGRNCVVMS